MTPGAVRGTGVEVHVDFGLCEANGICMGVIPEVFDLDEDDVLSVRTSVVGTEQAEQVREAVRQCPRQAISVVEVAVSSG